jgi:LPS export ABC transporter protein LptC
MRLGTIAVGAGLLILVGLLIQLVALNQQLREESEEGISGRANVLQLDRAILNQSENDGIHTVVWADRVEYEESRVESQLTNVRFAVYPDARVRGSHEPVEGSAKTARVRGNAKMMVLAGDVHIFQGAQLEVRGERLTYDYGKGEIRSADPVWLRDGGTYTEGQTLKYRIQEQNAQLTRPKLYQ